MMSNDSSKERQGFEAVNKGATDEASLSKEARGSTFTAVCNSAFAGRAEVESKAREKTSTSGWQDDAEVGDGRQGAKI
jgi:hypothetical protein